MIEILNEGKRAVESSFVEDDMHIHAYTYIGR